MVMGGGLWNGMDAICLSAVNTCVLPMTSDNDGKGTDAPAIADDDGGGAGLGDE